MSTLDPRTSKGAARVLTQSEHHTQATTAHELVDLGQLGTGFDAKNQLRTVRVRIEVVGAKIVVGTTSARDDIDICGA